MERTRRLAPIILTVILVAISVDAALDRGATRPTWATVALAVLAGFCLGVLFEGWLGSRQVRQYVDDAVVRLSSSGEVELFTTTTPDAFPPGTAWGKGAAIPTGTYAGFAAPTDGPYTITRLRDLGSFSDIHGKRHHHWRVYGRPQP